MKPQTARVLAVLRHRPVTLADFDCQPALKKRVKRPKRPSTWRLLCATMCVACAALAVWNLKDAQWLQAAGMLIDVAVWWRCLTRLDRRANVPLAWFAFALIMAGVLA
jgi:hypothetical protein